MIERPLPLTTTHREVVVTEPVDVTPKQPPARAEAATDAADRSAPAERVRVVRWQLRGLLLAHGTYTNPVKTTAHAGLYAALQKPVLKPLCHLMVWLAPVVRVLNWLNYLNGSAHRSTERDSFSGRETPGQLDFITRYYCKAASDAVGRGMLAMLCYDATDVLGRISVPVHVVGGAEDRTCLPAASRDMAEAIPGAGLTLLSPARHCGLRQPRTGGAAPRECQSLDAGAAGRSCHGLRARRDDRPSSRGQHSSPTRAAGRG
jgi:pimeloyl-ACP methyl ester carboxylesterase